VTAPRVGFGDDELAAFQRQMEAFIVEDVTERATLVLREAAETTAEAIVLGNAFGPGVPLDTGYLRASWRVGIGAPPPLAPATPPPSAARGKGVPLYPVDMAGLTLELTRATLGTDVYIMTHVGYAEYLETEPMRRRHGPIENVGAPTVFLEPVADRFAAIVDDAAVRVGYGA
jgi:hypothetical protein